MSLLIPSECDFEDAHGNPNAEKMYEEKLLQLSLSEPDSFKWKFEVVPGFFVQSDPKTDDLNFKYTEHNLGRLLSWKEIKQKLADLNANANNNECYKLIFCCRHGQGYHNYIVDKYGIDQWWEKWNVLGRDGDIVYGPDAMLTELGINQAKENHAVWEKEINEHGAPVPAKFYVSPLQRSLWTLVYTWEGLRPYTNKAIVTENLRETIGQNLCDKRSSKTVIAERFAKYGFVFEDGFEEEDILHGPNRETAEDQSIRVNRFCQSMFDEDWDHSSDKVDKEKAIDNSIICTTSHAGTIRLFIIVFGHRRFTISTGGMVPIVVKATRK